MLGRVDSGLTFTRLQEPYSTEPVLRSEQVSLVLTDTHFELDQNGRSQPIKGSLQWRIKSTPRQPHVTITAAVSYVRGVGARSKNPLLKARAEKTLADLDALSQLQSTPAILAGTSEQTPEAVLSQFVQMQMDGTGVGRSANQLSVFLVHHQRWQQDKIGVAKDYVVKRTSLSVNEADAYVQYAPVGELDSQLRFTNPKANKAIREDYKLVFDNLYPSFDGVNPSVGPSRWRIERAPTQQWISVSAAIHYVTEMRDVTSDPTIKANADNTLAALARMP